MEDDKAIKARADEEYRKLRPEGMPFPSSGIENGEYVVEALGKKLLKLMKHLRPETEKQFVRDMVGQPNPYPQLAVFKAAGSPGTLREESYGPIMRRTVQMMERFHTAPGKELYQQSVSIAAKLWPLLKEEQKLTLDSLLERKPIIRQDFIRASSENWRPSDKSLRKPSKSQPSLERILPLGTAARSSEEFSAHTSEINELDNKMEKLYITPEASSRHIIKGAFAKVERDIETFDKMFPGVEPISLANKPGQSAPNLIKVSARAEVSERPADRKPVR